MSRHPNLSATLLGIFVAGGIASKAAAIHDTWFAEFNDDVLTPIPPPSNAVGEGVFLEWSEPTGDGPRATAWRSLTGWARRKTGERGPTKTSRWREIEPFSLVFLVGRTGSGKTRLAHELAVELTRTRATHSRRAAHHRAIEWSRVHLPLWERKETDSWDAGLLTANKASADGLPRSFNRILEDLAKWRPRRPTLLVLDDPAHDILGKVLIALMPKDEAKVFRHPVRLLVVDKAIPNDAGVIWRPSEQGHPGSGQWVVQDGPLDPQPITLGEESWFSSGYTLTLLMNAHVTSLGVRNALDANQTAQAHVLAVTRGNPLLVGLAAEWLKTKNDWRGMTALALARLRAQRVLESLESVGISSGPQLAAIATATLLKGAPRIPLEEAFHGSGLPEDDVLARAFPGGSPSLAGLIPAIAPEVIGEAVVEEIIARTGGRDRANKIVAAVWRLDPLRALKLTRRRHRAGELADALRSMTPGPNVVSRVDLAMATIDLALYSRGKRQR